MHNSPSLVFHTSVIQRWQTRVNQPDINIMVGQVVNSSKPKLIELVKASVNRKSINYEPLLMEHFCQKNKLLSMPSKLPRNVSHLGGERSYMLLGSLARLEKALLRWSMNELVSKYNFTPVIVPNIIHDHIIQNCGFPTKTSRSQVYKISGNNEESILDENAPRENSDNKTHSCLAGTSEFALASIHIGDSIPVEELPKRFCAVSRCYRAEMSKSHLEWGLYRVHYFNKLEMVALTSPDKSNQMHHEFLNIQKDIFTQLGLQFQVLDMPDDDLGLSATKKFDIEAWLCGRQRYGEISSTSNCEDYQSSRLNIKYEEMIERDNQLQVENGFVHTVNGTACSTIRTLIALIEQHQTEDGRVRIPEPLVSFMAGTSTIPTQEDKELLVEVDLYPEGE